MRLPTRRESARSLSLSRTVAGLPQRIVVLCRGCGRGGEVGEVGAEGGVDLAGDVALEAAYDFALALSFAGAACGVGLGTLAVAQSADSDEVQRAVGLAVSTGVEAMAGGFA